MSGIATRPLDGDAEFTAAVALQRRTWGETFSELVPASMLRIAQGMGGVASGAFDGEHLVGLVFGISGVRNGRTAHWSDLLAVDPAYRGRGVGRLLKLHQREVLLELGIERVLWTFDPLEARNAHLNLTRLGAVARTYTRDAYGLSDSPLHAGIGTDRLLAEWDLRSPRVLARLDPRATIGGAGQEAADTAPFLADPPAVTGGLPRPGPLTGARSGDHARLAVPADIQGLKGSDPELARGWRLHVREALEGAFEAGLVAVELVKLDDRVAAYTLSRGF